VAFSPNGKLLAAGYEDGDKGKAPGGERGICLWDTATGTELCRIPGPGWQVGSGCLAFTDDGKTLVAAGDDGVICRYRVDTGKEVSRLTVPGRRARLVAASPDGTLAATNDWDERVLVWDLSTGRRLLAIPRGDGIGYRLAFSPDGRYLVLCGASYGRPDKQREERAVEIEMWELASGQRVWGHRLLPQSGVSAVALSGTVGGWRPAWQTLRLCCGT
jgi:WD40 repeat protein